MPTRKTRYDCVRCGAVGSTPSHATTCPAYGAGQLWHSGLVSIARRDLARLDESYVAEGRMSRAAPIRHDLEIAIAALRNTLAAIELAATGGSVL